MRPALARKQGTPLPTDRQPQSTPVKSAFQSHFARSSKPAGPCTQVMCHTSRRFFSHRGSREFGALGIPSPGQLVYRQSHFGTKCFKPQQFEAKKTSKIFSLAKLICPSLFSLGLLNQRGQLRPMWQLLLPSLNDFEAIDQLQGNWAKDLPARRNAAAQFGGAQPQAPRVTIQPL